MNTITVVIPLYNKQHYIRRALDSVLAQTESADEIIVVNDGSSDQSAELVRAHYPHVTVIDQDNQGVSVARNTGIQAASSNYIAFLDADDYWLPSFLSNVRQLQTTFPDGGMYFTHYAFCSEQGATAAAMRHVPSKPGLLENLFAACCHADLPITASSVCIKRSLLADIGGFPVGMAMGEDQVVWAKAACLSPVYFHPELSAHYDLGVSDSACSTHKVLQPAPQLAVYQSMLDDGQVPSRLISSLKYLMHLTVLSCAKNNLLHGDKQQARRLLLSHPYVQWDRFRLFGLFGLVIPRGVISLFAGFIRRFR
ncbi:glycosyltransferase family 2 protein [Vibrio sp. DNB22_10_4]